MGDELWKIEGNGSFDDSCSGEEVLFVKIIKRNSYDETKHLIAKSECY